MQAARGALIVNGFRIVVWGARANIFIINGMEEPHCYLG
jgi:hypothetical protein